MVERICELCEKRGLSINALEKQLNIGRGTISRWNQNKPSIDKVALVAEFFGVSTDYLYFGDSVAVGLSSEGAVSIPVLGEVAAGFPMFVSENIIDYEEIPAEMAAQGDYFGLRIKGDSMEPKISEGDVVVVRKQSDVDDGDIAVVLVNGESATVKRVKKRPEGLILSPTNPAFEPMFYSKDEVIKKPVQIIGRVVELRAKF